MGEHYEPFAQPVAQPVAQTADLTTRLLAALDSEERIMEVATLYVVGGLRRIVERHGAPQNRRMGWCETCAGDWPCRDLLDVAAALGVEP